MKNEQSTTKCLAYIWLVLYVVPWLMKIEFHEDSFQDYLESHLNRNFTERLSSNVYKSVVLVYKMACNSTRYITAEVLENNIIKPRLTRFSQSMGNDSYERMPKLQRPHQTNSIKSDVNSVTTILEYLSTAKPDNSWESKLKKEVTEHRNIKLNQDRRRQHKIFRDVKMRRRKRKNGCWGV